MPVVNKKMSGDVELGLMNHTGLVGAEILGWVCPTLQENMQTRPPGLP